MTNPELIILRHAKSDWQSDASTDFDRPLSKRGREDAPRMGDWIRSYGCLPEVIIASPAVRAAQTIHLVCEAANLDTAVIDWQERIYLASLSTLIGSIKDQVVGTAPPHRLMIVGHNPGLDSLLMHLCDDLPPTEDAKLLTTACLALLRLPDWDLQSGSAELIEYIRPKSLKS